MNWIKICLVKYINRLRAALFRDVLAMQYLAPLTKDYLPWNANSMRPSSIVVILNEIRLNKPRAILEFGCGISTIYMASLLSRIGGHVWTVENDAGWIDTVREILASNGLESYVTILHAPLALTNLSLDGSPWYNEDIIRPPLQGLKIDLLVVDGPPAGSKRTRYSRYPAVPFARDHLAEDYTILLHDIHRAGEQEILKRWGKELHIAFERRYRDGFIGLGRSKSRLDV